MRFFRVARDVVPAFYERSPIAHDLIETFFHPNASAASESLINLSGAVTFPRAQNVFEGVTRQGLNKRVHVVRHDDECIEIVAL